MNKPYPRQKTQREGLLFKGIGIGVPRTCRRCGETKDTNCFGKRSKTGYQIRPICKDCQNLRSNIWFAKKVEKKAGRPKPENCEVCGRKNEGKNSGKPLYFDHDHKTGAFRGWLCSKCNFILGQADDDPKILHSLILYLEQNGEGQ